jgi:hypothetical protein
MMNDDVALLFSFVGWALPTKISYSTFNEKPVKSSKQQRAEEQKVREKKDERRTPACHALQTMVV